MITPLYNNRPLFKLSFSPFILPNCSSKMFPIVPHYFSKCSPATVVTPIVPPLQQLFLPLSYLIHNYVIDRLDPLNPFIATCKEKGV